MRSKRWLTTLALFGLLLVGPVLATGCDEDYLYGYGFDYLPTFGGYGGFTDVFFGHDDRCCDGGYYGFDDGYYDDGFYDDGFYNDDFYFDGGFFFD